MARKVYISSDMSVDDRVYEVSVADPQAALIWPWILTTFDDWGRAIASPTRIKASTFPSISTVTPEIIEAALKLYDQVGLVNLYTVGGKQFMLIEPDKWFKWQTQIPKTKRFRDHSRIPSPDNTDCAQSRENARESYKPIESARSLTEPIESALNLSPSPTPSTLPPFHPTPTPTTVASGGDGAIVSQGDEVTQLTRFIADEFIPGISAYQLHKITAWVDEGMTPGAVRWAVEQAMMANVRRVDYVAAILRHLQEDGITTREAAETAAANYKRKAREPDTPGKPKSEAPYVSQYLEEFNKIERASPEVAEDNLRKIREQLAKVGKAMT